MKWNSWKVYKERKKRKNTLPLDTSDNIDNILMRDKETKYISQTLTLLFLSIRNCGYHA